KFLTIHYFFICNDTGYGSLRFEPVGEIFSGYPPFGKLVVRGHPSVDDQAGAGDVIGMVGSYPYSRSCDVLRLANTFVWL
ncbi:MAG: hypothetical protein PVI72_02690, partial [Desulfobacterales bacterium]